MGFHVRTKGGRLKGLPLVHYVTFRVNKQQKYGAEDGEDPVVPL